MATRKDVETTDPFRDMEVLPLRLCLWESQSPSGTGLEEWLGIGGAANAPEATTGPDREELRAWPRVGCEEELPVYCPVDEVRGGIAAGGGDEGVMLGEVDILAGSFCERL
jgi:hypothetical protein